MRNSFRVTIITICTLAAIQSTIIAEEQVIPKSNVEGKKLIAVTQALASGLIPLKELPGMINVLQKSGYDGFTVCISTDTVPDKRTKPLMQWRWWNIDKRSYSEFKGSIEILKSIKDWGRLTDNFLWMSSHVEGLTTPDWFNDNDWDILLANAELGARIAKEIGFKGITFDTEQYGGGPEGIWRQPWDYPMYASGNYKKEKGRKTPRSFAEVVEKVRQRGQQWAQALSKGYPDIVLAMLPGLYHTSWVVAQNSQYGGILEKSTHALSAAFSDGILLGLDERAMLVCFDESSYLDSQYRNLLTFRDIAIEQSLVMSAVPDLARKRLRYASGLWIDAGGYTAKRFSITDVRVNQRDPERHKHATHNALAVSDHYAWHWNQSAGGGDDHSSFITADPTPLMRQYWQANIDAHKPMDLRWEPQPHHNMTDYTQADAKAAKANTEFWVKMKKQGYKVAIELPEYWKFRLDTEMLCRFHNYWSVDYDDSSWNIIKSAPCLQSQGFRAHDIGLYRIKFDAPADLDGEKQQILLAFGSLSSGTSHLWFNGTWVQGLNSLVDVSKRIVPGESNQVGLFFLNKEGPGGLMGDVKLLISDRAK